MYKVFCDGHILYSPNVNDCILINPKLDLEVNKTGSFTFSIYPNHPNYDKIKKLKSIVTIYHGNKTLFRGRILDETQGFYNEKNVTCEGELAFLVDSIQRPFDYSLISTVFGLFAHYINQHNSQVEEEHRFAVGSVTVPTPADFLPAYDYSYSNTWDAIDKNLIKKLGGYLVVRHENNLNYIDYLAELTEQSNQSIEFGENLLTFSKKIKGADIATALIPLGAKLEESEDRLTVASVNSGKDYIYNSAAVDMYGWIYRTITFDAVTEATELLSKAQIELDKIINLSISIDLTAVDLVGLNAEFDSFSLGQTIQIKSQPHGIESEMLINKLSIDLLSPQSNQITLGVTYSTFTDQFTSVNKESSGILTKAEKAISDQISTSESKVLSQVALNYVPKSTGTATEPTLGNGWENYSGTDQAVSYQKDQLGNVTIRGKIKNGTTAMNTVIFTLSPGNRPSKTETFLTASATGSASIEINSDGEVSILSGASATWTSLSGITFKAS